MNTYVRVYCLPLILIEVLQYLCNVSATSRPIIGILAQDLNPDFVLQNNLTFSTIIASSYVKAIEAAGARVLPLKLKGKSNYKDVLNNVNGVLLPGGGAPLQKGNPYYDAVTYIYDNAIKMNENGIYFPILAVCLGFEAVLIRANNNKNFMTRCNVRHENLPLIFTPEYKTSLLYSKLPKNLEFYMRSLPVTINNHYWCITRSNLTKSGLHKNWLVTSENFNQRGVKFISSIEHKIHPIVGVQFHPEKTFEWQTRTTQNIPHSRVSIMVNQYFHDFLVDQSRLNSNHFIGEEEERSLLIENYQTTIGPAVRKLGVHEVYGFD